MDQPIKATFKKIQTGDFSELETNGLILVNPRIVKTGKHKCKYVFTIGYRRSYNLSLLGKSLPHEAAGYTCMNLPNGFELDMNVSQKPKPKKGFRMTKSLPSITVIADDMIDPVIEAIMEE